MGKTEKVENSSESEGFLKIIKKYSALLIAVIGLLVLICFALLLLPETQMISILQNSGLVAIISAFLGVIMTVAVTSILLEKQVETQKQLIEKQSERESLKDKDIKIYEQKINVYSEFTQKMWGMLNDDEIVKEELIALRNYCFQKLLFYLNEKDQVTKISKEIENIEIGFVGEDTMRAIASITNILQKNLDREMNVNDGDIAGFYNSFNNSKENPEESITETQPTDSDENSDDKSLKTNTTFWHFNMLGDEQKKAFKNGNWRLSLLENREDWRTNLLRQVKENDVIFLFQRGGSGYIGAFRAIRIEVIECEKWEAKEEKEKYEKEFEETEQCKLDMYDGINRGATLVSNIFVQPIAYNYKGVGYRTVRRRTIERINDIEAVDFLLRGFNGNPEHFKKNNKINNIETVNKLDENSDINKVLNKELNGDFLKQIIEVRKL